MNSLLIGYLTLEAVGCGSIRGSAITVIRASLNLMNANLNPSNFTTSNMTFIMEVPIFTDMAVMIRFVLCLENVWMTSLWLPWATKLEHLESSSVASLE